jgi:hypothetical protein
MQYVRNALQGWISIPRAMASFNNQISANHE